MRLSRSYRHFLTLGGNHHEPRSEKKGQLLALSCDCILTMAKLRDNAFSHKLLEYPKQSWPRHVGRKDMLFDGFCADGFISLTSLDNAREHTFLRFTQFADTKVLLHCKHQLFELHEGVKLAHT